MESGSYTQSTDQAIGDLSFPRLFFSKTTTAELSFSYTSVVVKTSEQERNWPIFEKRDLTKYREVCKL